MSRPYVGLKRILDIAMAVISLVVFFPILLIVSLAVRLSSGSPVLFKQERLGKNGVPFMILKFRTMCVDAQEQGIFEQKNDARVTGIGRILRKTSLDELPQLVNIIRGEMSFVGPRPVLSFYPMHYNDYDEKQIKRFTVRPGMTGLAQVNGRKKIPWDVRLEYDQSYVENCSFWLDFQVVVKTVFKVLVNADNYNA